ncbi:MAG TPA: urease accessory UreF family protein [Polyangiales bacterium]|nr:urease accessory UreF family protein [Polyangiales bacterium]
MEFAVQAGWVCDEASAEGWILGLIEAVGRQLDGPVFVRLYEAWAAGDEAAVSRWNGFLGACRESFELRLEDSQLGAALMRLLGESYRGEVAYATAFALAMVRHRVPLSAALGALLWAQAESQTSAALRLVPLGQSAGQRILSKVTAVLPGHVEHALVVPEAEIGGFAPGLALGSALHETQYTRLFRS